MARTVGKSDGIKFSFETFNLSQVHVKIDTLKVLDGTGNSSIKGDVSVELRGPVDIAFKLKYYTTTLHIKEFSMNFNARLTFTHPMSSPPYVKGAQMFLLNDPTIDFKYHGPPSKAFAQKLKEVLLAYTKTKMSYPNQVALPLDPQAKPREVYTMAPKGILAVNVHRATGLKAEGGLLKWMFGMSSPDTYVRSHLGSLKRDMTGVVKNDVNPVYGNATWIELPMDSVEGHELCFDVYEYSPTSDMLYGEAKLRDLDKVIGGTKTTAPDVPVRIAPSKDYHGDMPANASVGRLMVNMKWIPLSADVASKPAKLAYSTQSRRLISVVASAVTVDAGGPKLTQDQMKQGSLSCSLNPKGDPVKPFGQEEVDKLEFKENKATSTVSAQINREFVFLDNSKDSSGSITFQLTDTLDTPLEGKLNLSLLDHLVGSGEFRVTLKDKDLKTSMTLTVNIQILYLTTPSKVETHPKDKHPHTAPLAVKKAPPRKRI